MSAPVKLFASWFRDAASKTKAIHEGDQLIFPVVFRARIVCGLGAALFGPLFVASAFIPRNSILERVFFGLMAVWLFHYWPWRVVLDRDGISKRNYLGAMKLLRWAEVTTLLYREQTEDYLVMGRDGTKIWFSSFHVDPALFEAEVLKNSQLKNVEVTDPARDPYSSRRRPLI
jgi:hypothetical protein